MESMHLYTYPYVPFPISYLRRYRGTASGITTPASPSFKPLCAPHPILVTYFYLYSNIIIIRKTDIYGSTHYPNRIIYSFDHL